MRTHSWRWGPLFGLLGLAACSSGQGGPDGHLKIETSALTLEGIDEAIYTVTVENALGETVWQKELGSNQYGDGRGALTYVGPCDASEGANPNTVTVSVDTLVDDSGEELGEGDWVKPAPMVKSVDCVANADVLVAFNVTVMRNATQGFFDIAVNFSDIFCSAKLDCQPQLLHNPATGNRDLTAVVAFACTSGEGQDTTLYWGDAAIVCREGEQVTARYPVNPGAGEGNQGPIFASANPESNGVFEWAIYRTNEKFENQDIDKCAWTMALGLDLEKLGSNCTFEATATAADQRFDSPYLHSPPNTVYPLIRWKVDLTRDDKLVCDENPLNGFASGVKTEYSTTDGVQFQAGAACGGAPFFNQVACTGTSEGEPEMAFAPAGDGRVTVSYGGQTFGPFVLPQGTTMDVATGECCVEPCCEEAL